jgi:hypothetical protein
MLMFLVLISVKDYIQVQILEPLCSEIVSHFHFNCMHLFLYGSFNDVAETSELGMPGRLVDN